ncbi:MAG: SCO family protein [Candidatus Omnitrophica bacterium]|nr:SCO family protein [Candidatus Omnitrophota bacterium]
MNGKHSKALPYIGVVVSIAIVFLLVLTLSRQKHQKDIKYYTVMNPELDFSLKDQDGQDFHLRDHRGEIVLLFFGYLTCPDICPVTISKLSRAYRILGGDGNKILTVFITIDPERDTPQKLKEYLKYFKLNMIGLTGTKQEIDKVVDSYKASYQKVEMDSEAGYLMDHSDLVYLIDAKGRVVDLIHFDDEVERIAQMIKKVL